MAQEHLDSRAAISLDEPDIETLREIYDMEVAVHEIAGRRVSLFYE